MAGDKWAAAWKAAAIEQRRLYHMAVERGCADRDFWREQASAADIAGQHALARVAALEAVIREYLDACQDAAESWNAKQWEGSWEKGKRMDRAHDALVAALATGAGGGVTTYRPPPGASGPSSVGSPRPRPLSAPCPWTRRRG